MKLAQFRTKTSDEARLGLLRGDSIVDVTDIAPTTLDVIRRGSTIFKALSDATAKAAYALDAVEYLPAVTPGKMLAIGQNYADHAIEQGQKPPEKPLIFMKLPNSLSAHNKNIVLPEITQQVDFEAELAVVIGRRAKKVKEEDAYNYVFGYAPLNDVSARDLQFGDKQWIRGKGLDTFAPIGPFVTTKDEIENPHNLKIEGRLNGETMQSSNTGKMIFHIPFLISYISQAITLEPGDVIATGTPEGVGVFRNPPVFLKPGDVYEVEIEKLGTLRNPVVADSNAA
jgi:2-keto-4-pentenoate hydratase/2-oxohepta-3-ene-1,7-dioic acid hydratase in catechol pathway